MTNDEGRNSTGLTTLIDKEQRFHPSSFCESLSIHLGSYTNYPWSAVYRKERESNALDNLQQGDAAVLKASLSAKRTEYPDQPRVAVGAIVFKDHKVLLVRRGKPPARDLWAIPGGSVEICETLQQAAEREILEETGITIQALEPIYTFDYIERDESGCARFHYVIIDLTAEYVEGEPRAGDDAAEARWISSQEIATLKVSSKTCQLLKERFDFG